MKDEAEKGKADQAVAQPPLMSLIEDRAREARAPAQDVSGEVRRDALNLWLGYAWSDQGKSARQKGEPDR